MPRDSIALAAAAEFGVRACSIVLKLVPASEPTRPLDANSASAPAVSSIDRPVWLATSADWFSAMPRS
jgi:hypothetical protein